MPCPFSYLRLANHAAPEATQGTPNSLRPAQRLPRRPAGRRAPSILCPLKGTLALSGAPPFSCSQDTPSPSHPHLPTQGETPGTGGDRKQGVNTVGVKVGQPAGLQGSQGPRCKAARQGISDHSATDEVRGAREDFLLCGLWSDDVT